MSSYSDVLYEMLGVQEPKLLYHREWKQLLQYADHIEAAA